ncbi:MAG: LysR family transcriptional regulator [Pseudomonadota bacterium]
MSLSGLPPLTWLRAFEAAARHLSFTQAAQELNLTQSAISQHVRSLEGFLGRALFVRKTRALALTEAGSNYLPTVREAFDLLARGTRSFTGGDPGRLLTLQCNLAFSVHWLAPRLSRLHAAHPWLVLNIATSIWEPQSRLPEHSVEIRFGRPGDLSDTAEQLTDDVCYPVCAPDYQAGDFDLSTARLFDCAGVMSTWDMWASAQKRPFDRAADINLASTYVVGLSAAQQGGAMALGHDTLTADVLASGALVRPFEGEAKMVENYFLIRPASHNSTPASQAFVDWLTLEIGSACAG